MDIAIIIAFAYSKTNQDQHRHHLPGILIDIYHTYRYSKGLTDNIILITDLETHNSTKIIELKDSIINNEVDIEILNLLNIIKNNKQLYTYTSKKDLLVTIKRNIHSKKKVFIYYTGHSLHGNILLPTMNNEICYTRNNPNDYALNFSILRDALCNASSDAQIVVVLDCCASQGLHLPYKLQDKIYNLSPRSDKKYPLQEIICFSSTMSDEVSIASKNGSLFSQIFFKHIKLSKSISELSEILTYEIYKKFEQTPTIYSSYPNIKNIWTWLHRRDSLDIRINLIENYFTINI